MVHHVTRPANGLDIMNMAMGVRAGGERTSLEDKRDCFFVFFACFAQHPGAC